MASKVLHPKKVIPPPKINEPNSGTNPLVISSKRKSCFPKPIKIKIKNSNVGAYIEQLENKDIYSYGSGIPIAIKNNINVKIYVNI